MSWLYELGEWSVDAFAPVLKSLMLFLMTIFLTPEMVNRTKNMIR